MKEGWTYKRLGDICTIERGGSPRPIDAFITTEDKGFNWIKIGDAVEGSKYISSTKEKIKPEGLKKTRFVHKGDFILSNSMSFGKPYILNIDGCIHDGWLVIHDENDTFDKSFLYYLLGSPNMYREFKRLAVGGVVNNLNSKVVRDVIVPVPPLQEQERIVAELELLTGIIDKQKQQFKELDTLAQSIFYDMFGNPVENEKGWHCMNLREIASFKNGLNYTNKKSGRLVKVLGVSDFQNRSFVDSSEIGCVHIDDCFDDDYYLNDDDIVFVRSNGSKALIGRSVRVLTQGENITYSGYCIRCRITSPLIISPYLAAFVKTEQIHNVLTTGGRGCNIQNLNQTTLGDLIIPIPPLAIQNSFTKKIQSIKSQKESINCSIAESQKLFDYTMDKYFG